jgi:hypothetical protein
MIFRKETTVHNGITPESSGFHSGAVEDYVLPKYDAVSVSTRFWKFLALKDERIVYRRNSQFRLIQRCHATTQKSGVWI